MNRIPRGLALMAGLTALVGALPGPASAQTLRPSTVTVINTRGTSLAVYLDRAPVDIRIGTVGAYETDVLTVPWRAVGKTARVVVLPHHGLELVSPDIELEAGGNVDIFVPDNGVGWMPPEPPEMIPNPGPGVTTVTVRNEGSEAVAIFLEEARAEYRLGDLRPGQEKTITIPRWIARQAGDVELVVHPAHGLDRASRLFRLEEGAHLFVRART